MATTRKPTTSDSDAPPAAPTAPAKGVTLKVSEWADRVFPPRTKGPSSKVGQRPADFWRHAAAVVLHGWAEHAHHENEEMTLTEADYLKALEAAEKPNPKPHRAACSKHHPATKRAAARKG